MPTFDAATAFVSLHMDITPARVESRRGPDTFYAPGDAQGGAGRLLAQAIQYRFH